jgi:hypothetical protein
MPDAATNSSLRRNTPAIVTASREFDQTPRNPRILVLYSFIDMAQPVGGTPARQDQLGWGSTNGRRSSALLSSPGVSHGR